MAHELDFNRETGVANMIAVRTTPWHREGIVLPEHPDYWQAIRLAGLDYEVALSPATFLAVTPDGATYPKGTDGFVVVRQDRQEALGLVGNKYTCIQNTEAFGVLEPLVDDRFAQIQTAGVLRNGGDAWMLVRWNLERMSETTRRVFDGRTEAFALIAANHTGRRGVLLKDTPIEVVCANTLGAAEHGGGIVVRHTRRGTERVREAAEALWVGVAERYERIAECYYRLQTARELTMAQFEDAVCRTISPVTRLRPESPLAKVVAERVEGQWNSLRGLFVGGTGVSGNCSPWDAYMAATEALDHDPDHVFPTRGSRAAQLLNGHLADRKQHVLNNLLALVA